jgi:hypothetical protein
LEAVVTFVESSSSLILSNTDTSLSFDSLFSEEVVSVEGPVHSNCHSSYPDWTYSPKPPCVGFSYEVSVVEHIDYQLDISRVSKGASDDQSPMLHILTMGQVSVCPQVKHLSWLNYHCSLVLEVTLVKSKYITSYFFLQLIHTVCDKIVSSNTTELPLIFRQADIMKKHSLGLGSTLIFF